MDWILSVPTVSTALSVLYIWVDTGQGGHDNIHIYIAMKLMSDWCLRRLFQWFTHHVGIACFGFTSGLDVVVVWIPCRYHYRPWVYSTLLPFRLIKTPL